MLRQSAKSGGRERYADRQPNGAGGALLPDLPGFGSSVRRREARTAFAETGLLPKLEGGAGQFFDAVTSRKADRSFNLAGDP